MGDNPFVALLVVSPVDVLDIRSTRPAWRGFLYLMTLDTPLTHIHKLRRPQKEALARLGLATVRDALLFFPVRHESFGQITPVAQLRTGLVQAFRVKVIMIANRRTRRRGFSLTEAVVEDASGPLRAVWFNQPYLPEMLRPGTELILHGKVSYGRGGPQLSSPKFERVAGGAEEELADGARGHIVPVYPASSGISNRTLLAMIRKALPLVPFLEETLPEEVRIRQALLPFCDAVNEIHKPTSDAALTRARRRLAFEELYRLQLAALQRRAVWRKGRAVKLVLSGADEQTFRSGLPFSLTRAQERTWKEISADLSSSIPMHRLLQGDVGSGKTIVAALAAFTAARSGSQAVFMVPTDLLAKQHFATFRKLLAPFTNVSCALMTRTDRVIAAGPSATLLADSSPSSGTALSKEAAQTLLADGTIQIAIGTHALIQDTVRFKKLGLVIVDEQHRFGVQQRDKLRQAAGRRVPHMFSMTATPIPRTLAMALYADLDVSVLDELPAGRVPISTRVVPPYGQRVAEQFIRQQAEKGRQVFVVCPRIEEDEEEDVKSAEAEFKRLSEGPFSGLRVALLHGRLPKDEKDGVMRKFAGGELNVLVATSVIEVGVDVPNATVMAIYGAERFGLAQLHQFRGRVGRGEHASFCLAFVSHAGSPARRLRAFAEITDGFILAEQDLAERGPGELAGTQQSGLPDLRMASLMDAELLSRAQEEARRTLAEPVGKDLSSVPIS